MVIIKKYFLQRKLSKEIKKVFKENEFPILKIMFNKKIQSFMIYYYVDSKSNIEVNKMLIFLELALLKSIRFDLNNSSKFIKKFILIEDTRLVAKDIKNDKKNSIVILDKITNIDIRQKHILINGQTGSGKTFFLAYLIKTLKEKGSEIIIIDGKNTELEIISHFINKKNKNLSLKDRLNVVYEIFKDRQREYKNFCQNASKKEIECVLKNSIDFFEWKRVVLIIDEYRLFLNSLSKTEKINGMTEQKFYENILFDLVAGARSLNIQVIICNQRFSTDVIPNDMRINFSIIINLGPISTVTAQMLFNDTNIPTIDTFEGILQIENREIISFKLPFCSNLNELVEAPARAGDVER